MINQDFITASERVHNSWIEMACEKYAKILEIEGESKKFQLVHALAMAISILAIIVSIGVIGYLKTTNQL